MIRGKSVCFNERPPKGVGDFLYLLFDKSALSFVPRNPVVNEISGDNWQERAAGSLFHRIEKHRELFVIFLTNVSRKHVALALMPKKSRETIILIHIEGAISADGNVNINPYNPPEFIEVKNNEENGYTVYVKNYPFWENTEFTGVEVREVN